MGAIRVNFTSRTRDEQALCCLLLETRCTQKHIKNKWVAVSEFQYIFTYTSDLKMHQWSTLINSSTIVRHLWSL